MRTLTKLLGLTIALSSATAMAADNVTYHASSASTMKSSSSVTMSSSSASTLKGVISKDADNTEMNTRDKNDNTITAQKQTNGETDIDVLANVRKAIIDDENLSISAHNVKIMVVNGKVTLRGPVKSANEKVRVEELAAQVVGVLDIDNQLDVDLK